MTTLLHIDVSARTSRSLSRRLSEHKTLVILSSRGEFGFESGGVREDMNHLETHIRTCTPYLGVEKTHLIAINYQEFGDERHELSVKNAMRQCRSWLSFYRAKRTMHNPSLTGRPQRRLDLREEQIYLLAKQ